MSVSIMGCRSLAQPTVLALVSSFVLVIFLFSSSASAASIVVVTPSNMHRWAQQGNTQVQFTHDPSSQLDTSVLLYDTPGLNDRAYIYKALTQKTFYANSLDASYSTKRLDGSMRAAAAYSFRVDLDGDLSTTSDVFSAIYEPSYNNPGGQKNYSEWNSWAITQDSQFWYSGFKPATVTGKFSTLAQAIRGNESTARIIGIYINQGASNAGWRTMVDDVRFMDTTYDFEQAAGPSLNSPDDGVTFVSSQLSQQQSWMAVVGAAKYQYQSYSEDPSINPSAAAIVSEDIVGVTRTIKSDTAEGKYYWRVKAIGPFESKWSEVRSFSIDNTGPQVVLNEIAPVTEGESFTVSGSAVDATGANEVQLFVDGAPEGGPVPVSGGTFSTTISRGVGEYAITAQAKDMLGNEGTVSDPRTATVNARPDTTAPRLAIANIQSITEGGVARVTGSVLDDPSINNVKVLINDRELAGDISVVNGVFSFTLTGLSAGSYRVAVAATDTANNRGQSDEQWAVVYKKVIAQADHTTGNTATGNSDTTSDEDKTREVQSVRYFLAPQIALEDQAPLAANAAENGVVGSDDDAFAADNQGIKGTVDSSRNGMFSPLGIAWYWWLTILAAVAAVWAVIRGVVRANQEL